MYAPHTVTIYNAEENPETLELGYNITILRGVFLDVGKAAHINKTGLSDADAATLFIPFGVTAESPEGSKKTYVGPKAYQELENKAGHWTIQPGGESSGVDCFFVKDEVVSDEGYKTLRETHDYVFDVTTVDLRDFGTEDMQHWQVGGR